MSAPSLEVVAIQLRQIQSQIEQIENHTLWRLKELAATEAARMSSLLQMARIGVSMACARASAALEAERMGEASASLPVCASDRPQPGDRRGA